MYACQPLNMDKFKGFTLIELSAVIGLLGLFILFAANFYTAQFRIESDDRRIEGVTRDVWGVIDAVRAWEARNPGGWPTSLEQLVTEGYLRTVPATRYPDRCYGIDCAGYTVIGWDRSRAAATSNPTSADDLLIQFNVPGPIRYAQNIASRIPLGYVEAAGPDQYRVEARLIRGGLTVGGNDFVRLLNEDRTVVFDDGHLQGVSRITRQEQSTTSTRIDGAGIHLDTDELYVGVFNAGAQEPVNTAAYLSLQKSATETNTWASLLLWDANRSTHAMRFGLSADGDNKPDPYLSLLASNGSSLRMEFNKAASGSGVFHPAYWDIYLANKGSHPNHQSVQTRLCALEADSDDVDQDCTCERTASFSCSSGTN
ncbi:MAG: type II secretion system protein [Proteobacteria bacterium]|nr:type II secretion system protein [Pseudomonadota bacterium]